MSIATGGSSNGSSSVITETVFNMADELDVLALLRHIHLSALPLDIKNYLRDLVFSTRFGTPAPVDTAMIATFKTHGFVITTSAAAKAELSSVHTVPLQKEPRKPVALVIGFSRHAPQFTPKLGSFSGVQASVMETPEAAPEAPLPPTPPAEVVPVDPVAAPEVIEPINLSPVPDTTPGATTLNEPISLPPEVTAAAAPEPVSVPVSEPVVTAPQPLEAPVTEVETAPAVVASGINPSERIAAIKREVNGLVGNPVNLIDVNNEVGREYMNALLDAMKKTLGATPAQEIERAMARLERAFVAVKEALKLAEAGGAPVPVPEPVVVAPIEPTPVAPEPVAEVATAPLVAPAVAPESAVAPMVSVMESAAAEASEEIAPAVSSWGSEDVVAPAETPVTPEPVVRRVLSVASLDMPEGDRAPLASGPASAPITPLEQVVPVEVEPAVEPVVAPVSTMAPVASEPLARSEVITSVAKEKQLKELMEARQAAEAASVAERAALSANNPLMADEVTSGLSQLLSEWKLFKSSGLFGTGPSGYDHPLYKKISQLTMAAVLAGRFEGSTPEIKHSISDYMNGWRYEEGVIYEQGETFEHYLRRVIRHILDNQGTK